MEGIVLDWETAPDSFRDQAKQLGNDLKDSKTKLQEYETQLMGYKRRDAFELAAKEAGVEGVTLDEIGDLAPEQITPAFVKAKAAEKQAQAELMEEQLAKQQGFETVQEYRTVMDEARKLAEQRRQAQATQAGVASTTGTEQTAQKDAKTKAWEAYEEALKQRVPADKAREIYTKALREAEYSDEQIRQSG